jgi:preprotein translocase subunit YajC
MFQPWLMIFYKIGFMVLLVSTLGFIWWSHIRPKQERRQKATDKTSSLDVKPIEP